MKIDNVTITKMRLSVLIFTVSLLGAVFSKNDVLDNYLEVEFSGVPTHYGNPSHGCLSDEVPIRIQGLKGSMCTSACSKSACPTDLPESCDAKPQCVLENKANHEKYCALLCSKNSHCGTGSSCEQIQPGVGLCTYS
jgi:hypothetical protein